MKSKHLLVALVAVLLVTMVVAPGLCYTQAQEKLFPRVDRKMPKFLMAKWGIPPGYQFPNDWVKTIDWTAVKNEVGGTTVTMAIQGHDVSAPSMFREDFEKLSGIKVELIGVPSEEFTEKLLVEFLAGTAKYDTVEYYQGDTGMFIPYLADLAPYVDEWNYTDIICVALLIHHAHVAYKGLPLGVLNLFWTQYFHHTAKLPKQTEQAFQGRQLNFSWNLHKGSLL